MERLDLRRYNQEPASLFSKHCLQLDSLDHLPQLRGFLRQISDTFRYLNSLIIRYCEFVCNPNQNVNHWSKSGFLSKQPLPCRPDRWIPSLPLGKGNVVHSLVVLAPPGPSIPSAAYGSSRVEHRACTSVCGCVCVCVHTCTHVLNLQRKGQALLLWCWSVWLLVLCFMTRVTCWLFLPWGTCKDSLDTPWGTSAALLGYWHPLDFCPLAVCSWCSLCREAGVLSRWLWLTNHSVCPPALPTPTLWIYFPPISLKDSPADPSRNLRSERAYVSEHSVSTNTLQNILALPYWISGLLLSWVGLRDDLRTPTGLDSNSFRGVQCMGINWRWLSLGFQETRNVLHKLLFHLYMPICLPCCISPYCIHKLLEDKISLHFPQF